MATIDRTKFEGMVSTSVTIIGAGSSVAISISASSEGADAAILQLSEGSLDFGESETTKTFMVKNVGSAGTVLDWSISTPNVEWLTLTPMTGNTNAGSGTQVTAVVDRSKFTGVVTTTVTVNGSGNSSSLSVSAANVQAAMEVSTNTVDFGTTESSKTITIKNVGDEGSTLHWSIATPSVNWLTVSPMAGTVYYNQSATVTLAIDRNAFVGNLTTDIRITGANTTSIVTVSADNSVIVTDGLIAYYNFDDGAVTDWGGNYNGLNFDALASTDTPSGEGMSMEFDGQISYLYVPYVIMLTGNNWSYNVWFKMGSNNRTLYSTNTSGTCYILINSSSKLTYGYGNPLGNNKWITNNSMARYLDNQWHMMTITYNGSSIIAYIDGVLFETANGNGYYWSGNYYTTSTYFGSGFLGKMDNIRTYRRALTQDEVRALYNAKQ